jgi:hypothetical protein
LFTEEIHRKDHDDRDFHAGERDIEGSKDKNTTKRRRRRRTRPEEAVVKLTVDEANAARSERRERRERMRESREWSRGERVRREKEHWFRTWEFRDGNDDIYSDDGRED